MVDYVYLSIGSNIGNRRENCESAVAEIAKVDEIEINQDRAIGGFSHAKNKIYQNVEDDGSYISVHKLTLTVTIAVASTHGGFDTVYVK